MAVSTIKNNASKSYQVVTGQYTTAAWSRGTNTATWTAPEDGLYIAWMRFELHDPSDVNRKSYKQIQFQTNGISLIAQNQYYDYTTTSDSQFVSRTLCAPFLLKSGESLYPYIHTGIAGIVYDIQICAVKLGG